MRLLLLAIALALGPAAQAGLSVIAPAPEFALRDPAGAPVKLSDFRGQVVLVAFVYTTCTTTCPILGHQMATLQKRIKQDKLVRGRVMMLSVTVDPARDTAAKLAQYAADLNADSAGWRFLRDSPETLAPVLGAYNEWTKPMAGGELDHPARIYLVDAEGRIREIYSLAFFEPRQVHADIRALVR